VPEGQADDDHASAQLQIAELSNLYLHSDHQFQAARNGGSGPLITTKIGNCA
jgi:hypothetical protein